MPVIRSWQRDIRDDEEIARRQQYDATEAAGRTPCSGCGVPAQVYVRCHELRLSAPMCDACATYRMQFAAIRQARVSLDPIVGVPLPMTIDGIDVQQLIADVLNCAIGDHDVRAVQSVPDAVGAVSAVLLPKVRRQLRPSEQAAVLWATRQEFVRRRAQSKADLRETQVSLDSPTVFGL